MLEDKLPKNADDLISQYTDVINEYGLGSKEEKKLYKSIIGEHSVLKRYLNSIKTTKDAFERGIIS